MKSAFQKITSVMGADASKESDCSRCGDKLVKFKRHECRRCHRKICEQQCAKKDDNGEWICKKPCPIESSTSATTSSQASKPHEGNPPVSALPSGSASQASVQSGASADSKESVRKAEERQAVSSSHVSQLVQTSAEAAKLSSSNTTPTTTSKSATATTSVNTPGSTFTTVTTSAGAQSISTTTTSFKSTNTTTTAIHGGAKSSSVTSTATKTSVFTASENAFISTLPQTLETEDFVLRPSVPVLENVVATSFETPAAEVPLEPINAKAFLAEGSATKTEVVREVLTASVIAGSHKELTVMATHSSNEKAVTAVTTTVYTLAPAAASKVLVSEDAGVMRTQEIKEVLTASIIVANDKEVVVQTDAEKAAASTAVFALAPAAASKVLVSEDAGVTRTETVKDVLSSSVIAGSAGVTTVAPAVGDHDASTAVFALAPAAVVETVSTTPDTQKKSKSSKKARSHAGSSNAEVVTVPLMVAPQTAILGASQNSVIADQSAVVMHLAQTDVKEDERPEDLRKSIIPLEYFTSKWLLVSSYMRRSETLSEEDRGPMHALHATLILLKNLWYLDKFLQATKQKSLARRWIKIRSRICIGLVKDTKHYGNTSVSMGAASTLSFTQSVGLLNCGTGGIKYQLYTKNNGILYLQSEYKPKNGASPSALNIGGYKPKGASISLQEAKTLLSEELKQAPWAGSREIPVYAFVTGLLRQHWEEKSGDRVVLEKSMEELFSSEHAIKKFGTSYFLPQDEEGRLELLGSKAMYSNLTQATLLDKGTSIVGSFGIGRGTCQWTIMGEGETSVLIGHNAGMGNLPELASVSSTIISAYASDEEKARVFIETLESVERPVIALKSGCALLLENKSYDVKTQLVTPTGFGKEVQVQVARNKTNNMFPCTWRGSLALFCAEAGFKVDKAAGEEMEVVFRADGQEILNDEAVIEPNAILFVAPLNENFSG